MSTIIPINRATIRINPDEGRTQYYVAGPVTLTEVKVIHRGAHWYREVYVGTKVEHGRLVNGLLAESHKSETCERPADWVNSLSSRLSYSEIHTFSPAPRFLYAYEDTEITCDSCHEKFPHSALESDGTDDGYSETICPKCGAWDCCQLVPERLPTEELEQHAKANQSMQGSLA